MKHSFWLLIIISLLTNSAFATEAITIKNAWVRPTAPGQEVGAAYMDILSSSDATLVKVETSAAASVELHSMSMNNGVMKMRMLEELALPAGKVTSLAPGGLHLMLIDLKRPLKVGDRISIVMKIKKPTGKIVTQHINASVKSEAN